MKPLIIYCSRTGNTAKVVRAMAQALDAETVDTNAMEEIAMDPGALLAFLEQRPLVGLASGVFWARLDPSLYRAAQFIPRSCPVFLAFTNSLRGRLFIASYTLLLKRKILRLGLNVIGRWHCPGHDHSTDPLFRLLKLRHGRPDEQDLVKAQEFVLNLPIPSGGSA